MIQFFPFVNYSHWNYNVKLMSSMLSWRATSRHQRGIEGRLCKRNLQRRSRHKVAVIDGTTRVLSALGYDHRLSA